MPDRSTCTLFCASTRTWRASWGESCSIGVPPPEFRASRNSLMPLTTKAFTVGAGMFLPLCRVWRGSDEPADLHRRLRYGARPHFQRAEARRVPLRQSWTKLDFGHFLNLAANSKT